MQCSQEIQMPEKANQWADDSEKEPCDSFSLFYAGANVSLHPGCTGVAQKACTMKVHQWEVQGCSFPSGEDILGQRRMIFQGGKCKISIDFFVNRAI
jgi:hypothetical protein